MGLGFAPALSSSMNAAAAAASLGPYVDAAGLIFLVELRRRETLKIAETLVAGVPSNLPLLLLGTARDQENITDLAFVHLRRIHALVMSFCHQETITDDPYVNLRGILSLNVTCCYQITPAAFVPLRGIRILTTSGCSVAVHPAAGAVLFAEPAPQALNYYIGKSDRDR